MGWRLAPQQAAPEDLPTPMAARHARHAPAATREADRRRQATILRATSCADSCFSRARSLASLVRCTGRLPYCHLAVQSRRQSSSERLPALQAQRPMRKLTGKRRPKIQHAGLRGRCSRLPSPVQSLLQDLAPRISATAGRARDGARMLARRFRQRAEWPRHPRTAGTPTIQGAGNATVPPREMRGNLVMSSSAVLERLPFYSRGSERGRARFAGTPSFWSPRS